MKRMSAALFLAACASASALAAQSGKSVGAPRPDAAGKARGAPEGFVFIPAGKFWMGSPNGEAGRLKDEVRHIARLTRGFYMQARLVTQLQYARVMGVNPSFAKTEEDSDGDYAVSNGQEMNTDHPVESVTWADAREFIRRLNASQDEYTYRLPTEAEWEYAARAGTESPYFFGSDPRRLDEHAWYSGNSGSPTHAEAPIRSNPKVITAAYDGARTHAVGAKIPNSWGLYDMLGNVWEWTQDWYGEYPTTSAVTVDPAGPASGSMKVVRGGSVDTPAQIMRCAQRHRGDPRDAAGNIGFRLVAVRR